MLIWDDQTSNGMLGTAGVMMTKDEETKKYFKGSDVECVLCPRCVPLAWSRLPTTACQHHTGTCGLLCTTSPNNWCWHPHG